MGRRFSRVPAGPVLVGPCSPVESVRGAYRAAATAAVAAGRAVYLLDPEPEGVPESSGREVVVLCSWRPGRAEAAFPGLAAAREAGLAAAALFPLLPGWTGEAGEIEALAVSAKVAGAASLTGVAPAMDGEGRRAIVEARAAADPSSADGFFDLVHHGDWGGRMAERLAEVRASAVRHGLAALPPRPFGRGERPGNAAAAARLEEAADRLEEDEHRSALLYAGVRWIDDSARDLAAISREGNFRRIFPFTGEVAGEAEAALREVCGSVDRSIRMRRARRRGRSAAPGGSSPCRTPDCSRVGAGRRSSRGSRRAVRRSSARPPT